MTDQDMKAVEINKNIVATIYPNEGVVQNVVIICSATGVKQSYYESFATWLSAHGYTAITFDYQGIGDSLKKPIKQVNATASSYGEQDIPAVISYAMQELNPQHIFLMGHSIGGQLIGLSVLPPVVKGILLVAAQSGYWKFPGKNFNMENLPKGVALEWAKWCRSPNYLFDHLNQASKLFANINIPIVSYSFSDDDYAPKSAVDWLSNQYKNSHVIRKHIRPQDIQTERIGHFGIFKEKCANILWVDFIREMEKIIA
jgi:predicted alpha/beta hydrolase